MRQRIFWLAIVFASLLAPNVWAAGKNKVNYDHFDWKIYQSPHYKFYFYPEAEQMLEKVVDMSEAAYKVVSEKLQHELDFPVPMIIFKTHEEFLQNNIAPGFLPRAVAAFAEPFQSRMVLPIDRTDEDLFALITHELTHIFQYDMLYNNRIGTIIRASAPIWFIEGMASWVADDETNLDRMVLRDVAVNGGFNSLGAFQGLSFLAYRVGHAAFQFMEERYGIEGVRNFLWQYRKNVTGNVSSAIERAFEIEVSEFDRDFRKYLRKRYIDLLPVKEEPDDYAREIRTRRVFTTLSPELSPSGDLFAAIVPLKNETDLVLISTKDGRIFRNLTKGHTNRYTEINVNAYRGVNDLGWSPDGNQVVFTALKEGTSRLFITNVLNGRILHDLYWKEIRDAQSPIFGPDGNTVYFIGNRNGNYDIFRYDLGNKSLVNVTEDEHHDQNPRLSPDGKKILYSSLRDNFYKVFELDTTSGEKVQLTSGIGNDIQASFSQDMKAIYFSSDRYEDIYNIFELNLETGAKRQYTDILTGAFSPQERISFDHKEGVETKQLVFTAYYQGRYRIYRMDKPEERAKPYEVAEDNYENIKNYEMSADLKLDPRRFRKYTLKNNFSISGANVSVGSTSDGRFISDGVISLSDTVGNRVLNFTTASVSSYESYYLNYLDRSRRLQWGANFISQQSFFIDRRSFQVNPVFADRQERTYKRNEVSGYLRYPMSFNTRIDVVAGMTDQDRFAYVDVLEDDDPTNDDNAFGFYIGNVDYTEPFVGLAFSYDTAAYKNYGPQHGTILDIQGRHELNQSTTASLQLRVYREISRRSLFAFRLVGDYSDGDTPQFFYLGGNDNLRGDYDYYEFVGSKRVLTQFEVRFPLIDVISFPGGIAFTNIRGALFADVGSTWFRDDDFNFEFQDSLPGQLQDIVDQGNPHEAVDAEGVFYNPENPNSDYLLGAYGLQVSMNLLGLDVHWTWARRTNFDIYPSDSRLTVWIGRNF